MMIAILEKHSCDMRHSETYETYRTAKAVIVPASSVVERNNRLRERRIFSPIVTAYSSPNSRRLSGLMVSTANSSPANTDGTRIRSCPGDVTQSPHRPNDKGFQRFLFAEVLQYLHDSTYAR